MATTLNESLQSTEVKWDRKPVQLLVGLVAVSLLGNVMLPRFLFGTHWDSWWMQVAFLASGMLVGQFSSLALWCVLGRGAIAPRVAITFGLNCLSCFSFIFGCQLIVDFNKAQVVYIAVGGVGGFLLACLPLLVARFLAGYRFYPIRENVDILEVPVSSQISLKFLIGLTTGIAVLVAMFLSNYRAGSESGFVMVVFWLILQNAVFTLSWLWTCVVLFSRAMAMGRKIVTFLCVCFVITPIHLYMISWVPMVEVGWIEVLNAYAFAIGLCAYTWVALMLARTCGFELLSTKQRQTLDAVPVS